MMASEDLHKDINNTLEEESTTQVHTFDPDDTPAQKKAQVMETTDLRLPHIDEKHLSTHKAGDGDSDTTVHSDHSRRQVPGSFYQVSHTPNQPIAGWTGFSTLPNPGDEKSMSQLTNLYTIDQINDLFNASRDSNGEYSSDFVARLLCEKYYGIWYYDTSAVFAAIFFTWLLTRLGLSIFSCFIVGAFFATYYRTSIKRTRRNARDDIERQVSLNRLYNSQETVGWLNLFLGRFWLIFEPILSAQVIDQVDSILNENCPSFLDSIRLTSFTLGTKAPRVDGVQVYPGTAPDIICMDWDLSFVPNDILDLTERELQSKINPKIVLTVRVGKGMVGAGMPVLLENLMFRGKLRVQLKLFNQMPVVKLVDLSFLRKPEFDYVLKPVGGDTFGFDINNIPGFQTFIKDQIHASLGPMMYAPNIFTLDVAGMMSGDTHSDSANGALAITMYSANGLKPNDRFGTLDPYCSFHLNNIHNPELARTSAIENSSDPKWNETHFLLLSNLHNILCIKVMDKNSGRNDVEVGVANLDLNDLGDSQNGIEGLNLTVFRSGKPVGELKADVRYFPASKPEKKEDGTILAIADSNSGILRFGIQECQDIGGAPRRKRSGIPLIGGLPAIGSGNVNSYAIVKVNGQVKLRTSVYKGSIKPRWNKYFEVFVPSKTDADLEVDVMNKVEFGEDVIIGRWNSTLNDMQNKIEKEHNDWWNLTGGTGKIHLDMLWKPVPLTGFSADLAKGSYKNPIGVVRIKLVCAKNLRNVEALTGGKSDPYVRVMSGLQLRGRTEAILDNLDPEWDTSVFVPIHSMREDLMLELMDYNEITSDKFLGMCDLFMKDLIKETKGDDEIVYDGHPAISRTVKLLTKDRKPEKGQLTYEAQFFPTLALARKKETEETNDDQLKKEESSGETKENTADTSEPLENHNSLADTSSAAHSEQQKELHGEIIQITPDNKINLLSYQSGVLSVTIHEVMLPSKQKALVEVLLDSNDAQFRSSVQKGQRVSFEESGDAFVKELDFSHMLIRVRSSKDDDASTIGYWATHVSPIIKQLQEQSAPGEVGPEEDKITEFRLLDCPQGTISLSFKYTPVVKFVLDPEDSIENQGQLTVTAVSASGLKGVDKSGTSDPYCVFLINGIKVYKTEVYKKQLSPVFRNEIFATPIYKRSKAKLYVKVFDWDQIGSHRLIAEGPIDIEHLESFLTKEQNIQLSQGVLNLRLKWEPQLLARKREGTSLLGSTTRILTGGTGLAGEVVGAGGKVLDGGTRIVGDVMMGGTKIVGGGIGAIGRGIGRFGGRRMAEGHTQRHESMISSAPSAYSQMDDDMDSQMRSSPASSTQSVDRPLSLDDKRKNPTLRITVVEAKDIKIANHSKLSNPYCRVSINGYRIRKTKCIKRTPTPQWEETFTTKVFETSEIKFTVKDRRTLADAMIGVATLNVENLIHTKQPFDGWLPLSPSGTGQIHVKAEFVHE
ncbi:C2 domain-containing protein [Pilobolus umbonatus]|nr:C2 domain-containing protein [Pilobolus umbonatus]